MKTNRAAAKRFRANKKGKIKRDRAYLSHLRLCKNAKRKRRLRQPTYVSGCELKRVRKMLGI